MKLSRFLKSRFSLLIATVFVLIIVIVLIIVLLPFLVDVKNGKSNRFMIFGKLRVMRKRSAPASFMSFSF